VTQCPETSERIDTVHKMEGSLLEGKYRVGMNIAEGGMGVVYEGTHVEIDRKVAIKFLQSGASMRNPRMLERFRNEARIAASLGNRNIVDVLDMGTTHGRIPYIVMEYLEGSDLDDFLDAADRLPVPWAVDITIQILKGLSAVHARGIVHRDLKPANVVLVTEPDGGITVKLVDFGISRLKNPVSGTEQLTRTGAVVGTPHYMAPEQARGLRDIDPRADLYSVGVILYRMLTSTYPFDADDYNNLIISITTEKPVHVGKHGAGLPPGLEAVVMWSIARSPDERFQDAEEFIEALLPYAQSVDRVDDDSLTGTGDSRDAVRGDDSHQDLERVPALFQEAPTAPPPKPDYPREQTGEFQVAPTMPPPPSFTYPMIDVEELRGVTPVEPVADETPAPEPVAIERAPARGRRFLVPVVLALLALMVVSSVSSILLLGGSHLLPALPPQAASWIGGNVDDLVEIELDGLPAEAEVFVEDVLHPERPLLLERSRDPRRMRITSNGYETWERDVAVISDAAITISLEKNPTGYSEETR